jgi:hypothetical protein
MGSPATVRSMGIGVGVKDTTKSPTWRDPFPCIRRLPRVALSIALASYVTPPTLENRSGKARRRSGVVPLASRNNRTSPASKRSTYESTLASNPSPSSRSVTSQCPMARSNMEGSGTSGRFMRSSTCVLSNPACLTKKAPTRRSSATPPGTGPGLWETIMRPNRSAGCDLAIRSSGPWSEQPSAATNIPKHNTPPIIQPGGATVFMDVPSLITRFAILVLQAPSVVPLNFGLQCTECTAVSSLVRNFLPIRSMVYAFRVSRNLTAKPK